MRVAWLITIRTHCIQVNWGASLQKLGFIPKSRVIFMHQGRLRGGRSEGNVCASDANSHLGLMDFDLAAGVC